jgi:hypothetical protein
MKNKKLLFLSTFLFLALTLTAQKNYQPGWLVLNNGDTVRGQIDYRNWERNPRTIRFKQSQTAEATNYTVETLQSFEVAGEDYYLKAIVIKDMLPVKLNALEFEGEQKMITDTVFLRSVIQGDKISLYELIDDKPHYFIQQPGGTFEELIYQVYLSKSDRLHTVTHALYKDQLKRFAINNTSLRNRIDNSDYREKDLTSVIRKLNNVTADEKTVTTRSKNSRFFAGAGVSMNKINFSGGNSDLNVLTEEYTPGVSVGVGGDLLANRGLQALFLRFSLHYQTMSYKGRGTTTAQVTNHTQEKQYDLKMSMVSPAVSIFYTVLRSETGKLHVGVGAGYNFTTYRPNTYTTTDTNTGEMRKQENYLDLDNWLDVHGKIGYIVRGRFELQLDTRLDGTFTNFMGVGSTARSYTFSVNCFL